MRPCRAEFDRLDIYICLIFAKKIAEKVLNFSEKVILPKDLLKVHVLEKRLFRVRVSGILSTGNGKE